MFLYHFTLYGLQEGVESRATQSVRVPVKNLARISPNLNVSLLQEAVGWQFLRTNVFGEDEGFEAASNQRGFQMIRPDNDWFPGLDHLRQEFYNHQWIFGKTPKFKVSLMYIFVKRSKPYVSFCKKIAPSIAARKPNGFNLGSIHI